MTSSPHVPPVSSPRRILRALESKGWLKPFRNAGLLAIGGGAQGIIQLAAIALASQALGVAGFGTLVLIDTARRFVGGIIRLRSKDVVMRYGARALQSEAGPAAFNRVLAYSLWLDVLSAIAALTAILLAMGAAANWLNMAPEYVDDARIYGLLVVFVALSSSAEAVLRLFDRFDLVAAHTVVAPIIQVAGSALAFAVGADLMSFLVVWFVAHSASQLVLMVAALWELHRRGRLAGVSLHPKHLAGPEPGVWRFAASTNVMSAFGKIREHGTMFAVAALLDPAAAGLVHVAQRLGKLPGKPVSKILTPAFFPEIARQTAERKHRKRRKTVWRSTAVVGGVGVVLLAILVLFGETLLATLFGPAFSAAYAVMLLFGVGGAVKMLTFAVRPVLISAGRVRILLWTTAALTMLQIGLLVLLIPRFGIIGTGLAQVAPIVLFALIVVPVARHELRRPRDAAPASAVPTNMDV